MLNFYFFHVGQDIFLAKMLVGSIKISNPSSKIYQITDNDSPEVQQIDGCLRFNGKNENIMKFRMETYASINIKQGKNAIFLDTDMLVVKELNEKILFKENDIVFCERQFDSENEVNVNYNDLNMYEFKNMKMGEAWPYLGCFLAIRNKNPIYRMNKIYNILDEKYKRWYGDQIVLKIFASRFPKEITFVGENQYACVPGALFANKNKSISKNVHILHFKGKKYKNIMVKSYNHLLNNRT